MKKLIILAGLFLSSAANASIITVTFEDLEPYSNGCVAGTYICTTSEFDFWSYSISSSSDVSVWRYDNNTYLEVGGSYINAGLSMNITPGSQVQAFKVLSYDVKRMTDEMQVVGVDTPFGEWFTVIIDNPQFATSFSIEGISESRYGGFFYIDNIVVSTVPIPPALLLFPSALAGLAWFRRKS